MFCIKHIIFNDCEKLKFYKVFILLIFLNETLKKKLILKF